MARGRLVAAEEKRHPCVCMRGWADKRVFGRVVQQRRHVTATYGDTSLVELKGRPALNFPFTASTMSFRRPTHAQSRHLLSSLSILFLAFFAFLCLCPAAVQADAAASEYGTVIGIGMCAP